MAWRSPLLALFETELSGGFSFEGLDKSFFYIEQDGAGHIIIM